MAWPWVRTQLADDVAHIQEGLEGSLVSRDLAQIVDSMIAQGSDVPYNIRALPAVVAAIRLISSTIDQIPLTVTRGDMPNWIRRTKAYGSGMDQGDMLGYVVDSMANYGRAYLLCTCLTEGDAPAWRLDALDPQFVQVRERTDGIVGRDFLMAGAPIPEVPAMLSQARKGRQYLLHIPYRVTVRTPAGSTPLTEAAAVLNGHVTVEQAVSQLFNNGTYVGGVLSTTQEITPAQARATQDLWIEATATGKVRVIGNGLEYRNELATSEELQLIQSRSFNQSVIWTLFGIPQSIMGSSMMGGQSSLSYANASDNRRTFLDNCIKAFTTQIEASLSRLLPPGRNEDEDTRFSFDFDTYEGQATYGNPATGTAADPRPDDPVTV